VADGIRTHNPFSLHSFLCCSSLGCLFLLSEKTISQHLQSAPPHGVSPSRTMKRSAAEEGEGGETAKKARMSHLYLDTVNRQMLDFDQEKVCSVTLSDQHVYCCLVCGKFFQGRGRHTPAFTHAVHAGHHVTMQLLEPNRIFVLPGERRKGVEGCMCSCVVGTLPTAAAFHRQLRSERLCVG
jgi:hypothetical protein